MPGILRRRDRSGTPSPDPPTPQSGHPADTGADPVLSNTVEALRQRTRGPGAHEFATRSSTRAFLVLIVLGVLSGPAALLLSSRTPPAPTAAPAATTGTVTDPADTITAGSTAATLVRAWLSAGQQDLSSLAALTQLDVSQVDLPARRPTPPSWVQISSVTRPATPGGLWTAVVLAGGGEAGTSSAWRVLIHQDQTGFSAVSLPARIGTPTAAGQLPGLDGTTQLDPAGTLGITVSGFAGALLTGSADAVARWTSPAATFTPTGRVCAATTLAGLLGPQEVPDVPADGDRVAVLATIQCTPTGAAGPTQAMQYPLVLTARSGRWEVSAYADVLPGSTPAQSPPAVPATSSPTRPAGSASPSGPASSSAAHPEPTGTPTR